MCGIVGYVGPRDAVPLLIDGLRRLEYRGYDSAGVAVVHEGMVRVVRAKGKLARLITKLDADQEGPIVGSLGLGHTRWATHGVPSERNAHPMVDARGRIALIHNGIVENFLELKQGLLETSWSFKSDTDTEVVANQISSDFEGDLRAAVLQTVARLSGMYSFAVISNQGGTREMVAVRNGPPLVIGRGDGENFLASDPAAILPYTKRVTFLENGDCVRLTEQRVDIVDFSGQAVQRQEQKLNWDPIQVEKGGFKHFMLKEIHEQPQAIQDTFGGRVDFERQCVGFEELTLEEDFVASLRQIHLLACGTSWYAGLVGKFIIEELTRIPVEVAYGSEYRYRNPIAGPDVLAVGISQSGETADTLSAMQAASEKGARLLALCNVQGSEAMRISDGVLLTHAGPEIGVASTKAFTTQLVALVLLGAYLRQQAGKAIEEELFASLAHLPQAVNEALQQSRAIQKLARKFSKSENFLYLGRGIDYPIAMEGALKLKEISYIHAEGYPAGEMKHGPIALIEENFPVVALVTGDRVYEKVLNNLQEVKARDGRVIVVTDRSPDSLGGVADEVIQVPRVHALLQPIVDVIPLQLFAYYVGVHRGADVDQPRNLAKSVTVE
jgi:glucosamine--fructose-6-phosphate aminotransferase (isomerizing)